MVLLLSLKSLNVTIAQPPPQATLEERKTCFGDLENQDEERSLGREEREKREEFRLLRSATRSGPSAPRIVLIEMPAEKVNNCVFFKSFFVFVHVQPDLSWRGWGVWKVVFETGKERSKVAI